MASALAGGDCIDDADALRAGGTEQVLGCTVKASSTLGTFPRSFRWGHVRHLDRVSRELLARGWAAGAGSGADPLTNDLDSTVCETYGLAKEGAQRHNYAGQRGYHPLFANYSYHACITDRDGDTLYLEADHRRHAEIENTIRGLASSAGQALKYDVRINHLPAGRFPANPEPAAGSLAGGPSNGLQPGPLDHAHRSGRADDHRQDPVATCLLPGQTPHPQRTPPTLQPPQSWPSENQFSSTLAELRTLPLPS